MDRDPNAPGKGLPEPKVLMQTLLAIAVILGAVFIIYLLVHMGLELNKTLRTPLMGLEGSQSAIARHERGSQVLEGLQDALLPMIGIWVGTVLAFYFSRENFNAAARNAERLARVGINQEQAQLQALTVGDVMIRRGQMRVFKGEKDDPMEESLTTLKLFFDEHAGLNRALILKEDRPKLVIHKSSLLERLQGPGVMRFATVEAEDEVTIKAFVEEPAWSWLSHAFICVKASDSLDTVKRRMSVRDKCADAFVTETGDEAGTVVGYVSDVDITRALQV